MSTRSPGSRLDERIECLAEILQVELQTAPDDWSPADPVVSDALLDLRAAIDVAIERMFFVADLDGQTEDDGDLDVFLLDGDGPAIA